MSLKEQISQVLDDLVKTPGGPPGAVFSAVDRNGNVLVSATSGLRNIEKQEPMTIDTDFYLWSCTKVVASSAILHAIENGVLRLDDPVSKYLPDIANTKTINEHDGQLYDLNRPLLVKDLLSHTAGIGYTFFSKTLLKYTKENKLHPTSGKRKDLYVPTVHQPGDRFTYGLGIDLAVLVLEKATGQTIEQYTNKNLFEPLGIKHLSYESFPKDTMAISYDIHNDKLKPSKLLPCKPNWEYSSGGGGLMGQVPDFLKFLTILLNNGKAPNGAQILKPETVKEYIFKPYTSHIPDALKNPFPSLMPPISAAVDLNTMFGHQDHSLAFAITHDKLSTGRNPGSGWWAGLANLYYGVDPTQGVATMIGSSTFPFLNKHTMDAYFKAEKLVYDHLKLKPNM